MRDLGTCRSCGAPIVWVKTAKGKKMPLDREPNEAGNITLMDGAAVVVKKGETSTGVRYMPQVK